MSEIVAAPVAPDGRPRLFFYVQHLLGLGHLVRAARIAKALAAGRFDVTVAMGGVAPPELDIGRSELLRLPPVKVGTDFGDLVQADGQPFDGAARAARGALLLAAFERCAPDVLMIEAFPFGRRQMRFELVPLVERARTQPRPPLVVASVRDILQRDRRPERAAETVESINRYFDLVLVHGDPRLARLEASFAPAHVFEDKIAYTGLVAPDLSVSGSEARPFAVVVSAGGGAVGWQLLEAAIRARPLTTFAAAPWLVLTGPNLPPDRQADLAAMAGPGVTVRAFVPDLAGLLARAAVSISQAGYNTVSDLLVANCRAVVIPFATDGETEQGDRAERLAALGLAVVLPESDLTADRLAVAIEAAVRQAPSPHRLDLGGAVATAVVLTERLARHRAVAPKSAAS